MTLPRDMHLFISRRVFEGLNVIETGRLTSAGTINSHRTCGTCLRLRLHSLDFIEHIKPLQQLVVAHNSLACDITIVNMANAL